MEKILKKKIITSSHNTLMPIKLQPNHLTKRRNLLATISQSSSLSPEKIFKNSLTTQKINLIKSSNSVSKSRIIISSNKSLEKLSPIKKKTSKLLNTPYTLRTISSNIPNILQSFFYKSVVGSVNKRPKKANQDSLIIIPASTTENTYSLFGVMDGHGVYGHHISSYIKFNLPLILERKTSQILANSSNYPLEHSSLEVLRAQIIDSFSQLQNDLKFKSNIDIAFSGSTTITVLIRGRQIICTNLGDSRAVLGRFTRSGWKAVALSWDHKPEIPGERERIEQSNGRVDAFRDTFGNSIGPQRVWLRNESIPGLAMSRSLGDEVASRAGVISTPEVFIHSADVKDKFLIIASDGIWEFISSEEAVQVVSSLYLSGKINEACENLISLATNRWIKEDNSIDDITLILIFLSVKDTNI